MVSAVASFAALAFYLREAFLCKCCCFAQFPLEAPICWRAAVYVPRSGVPSQRMHFFGLWTGKEPGDPLHLAALYVTVWECY